jgi:hypothetical protein
MLPFVVVFGKRLPSQPRAEQQSGPSRSARRSTNEIAPTQLFLVKFIP